MTYPEALSIVKSALSSCSHSHDHAFLRRLQSHLSTMNSLAPDRHEIIKNGEVVDSWTTHKELPQNIADLVSTFRPPPGQTPADAETITVMALSPSGGIAVRNPRPNRALDIPGHAYDPFGDTWHWSGRAPYAPAAEVANMLLHERPQEWQPTDPQLIRSVLSPGRTIPIPTDTLPLSQTLQAMPTADAYLMAIADAKVIMRNLHTGMSVITLSDGSQAHIHPTTMALTPA